jgi:hypothetical protein
MAKDKYLAEVLEARRKSRGVTPAQKAQEFIVSFSPSGTLRWKIINAQSGQPRPPVFGRSDVRSDALVGSRIIATPEGNPTGFFAAGFNENVEADISVFFFCDGAGTSDSLVYQKERGDKLELHLFVVQNNNPVHIFNTMITDDQEHSVKIQIPA